MNFLLKSTLLLLVLASGSLSYADLLPGQSILSGYSDSSAWGKPVRAYASDIRANKTYQGALIKNSVNGWVPGCNWSPSNRAFQYRKATMISEAYTGDIWKRLIWKKCQKNVQNYRGHNLDLIYLYNGAGQNISNYYVSVLNKVYLPLQKRNGDNISKRPKLTEWKLF